MSTAIEALYAQHLERLEARLASALAAEQLDGLVISSGKPLGYFADDQEAPLRPTPHFAHWLPLEGAQHLLLLRPGRRPRLVRHAPEDYWYEQAPLGEPHWAAHFELASAPEAAATWKLLGASGRCAYIGDEPEAARAHGLLEVPRLCARLDWERALKTGYEVACMEEAQRLAGLGHAAARAAFEAGASELETHQAYVAAVGCTDKDLPYETIIAHEEKGATLHYTGKRTQRGARVLLIDAGARHRGYCSDITRTWTSASCDARFRELVLGLDQLQRALCARVRPGLAYLELHREAHRGIAELLRAAGVLRVDVDQALELGLTRPFFPHGLGHFLGLQVHDVGGRQLAPEGGSLPPPPDHPYLRTTRTIAADQVFTIEPGIYFIEMLLREHRGAPHARAIDWQLVRELAPCGGIRIEDNVLVTASGHRNLTRPQVA